MSITLHPFGSVAECPACGKRWQRRSDSKPHTEYCDTGANVEDRCVRQRNAPEDAEKLPPHLHCRCPRCAFHWLTLPCGAEKQVTP
jgi:hypothetical protein